MLHCILYLFHSGAYNVLICNRDNLQGILYFLRTLNDLAHFESNYSSYQSKYSSIRTSIGTSYSDVTNLLENNGGSEHCRSHPKPPPPEVGVKRSKFIWSCCISNVKASRMQQHCSKYFARRPYPPPPPPPDPTVGLNIFYSN